MRQNLPERTSAEAQTRPKMAFIINCVQRRSTQTRGGSNWYKKYKQTFKNIQTPTKIPWAQHFFSDQGVKGFWIVIECFL